MRMKKTALLVLLSATAIGAVTLDVRPFEARKQALASTVGSLSLSLRNETAMDPARTWKVGAGEYEDYAPAAPVIYRKPNRSKYTVIYGSEATIRREFKNKNGAPGKSAGATQPLTTGDEGAVNASKASGSTTQQYPALNEPKLLAPKG